MAHPRIHLRVTLAKDVALGPGKAALLEHVAETGSISAAARAMDMSYRRAWLLIAELNACFDRPLVETAKGGRGGGGRAVLTPLGVQVMKRYRAMEAKAVKAIKADLRALAGHLR
jgi:molybdate transport system regulatory protein